MFSTLPLNDAQVTALREQHGIYMTDSARINVAGLREADIPRFVEALKLSLNLDAALRPASSHASA